MLIYVLAHGDEMSCGSWPRLSQDAAMRSYVQDAAGTRHADEIAKLAALRDQGRSPTPSLRPEG
ncbi:MAG: hypothetical protein IPO44_00025 [Candidatus Microthrix sp.]|nr:hypothetical protein [Candidatus Microthrix sp.]MBK9558020.1 hypothetical protein [Candidatus Microthrix sp.]